MAMLQSERPHFRRKKNAQNLVGAKISPGKRSAIAASLVTILAGVIVGCQAARVQTPSDSGHPLSSPSPGMSSSPVASSTSSANPLHSAYGEPLFRFRELALERVDGQGNTLWSAPLPAEKYRQMAVLGKTVLVWGPRNELRRFDADSGQQLDLTLSAGEVSVFRVYDDILVQSTATGLTGVGEKSNIWHRPDIQADAMAVGAGPADNPVVLLVGRLNGVAKAVELKSGKDAKFPVPRGAFTSLEIDRDSGVVTWLPRVDGPPVHTNLDDGKPF